MKYLACLVLMVGAMAVGPQAQEAPVVDPVHRALDAVLDTYVRDGLVYYRALRQERGRFDRYVSSLAGVDVDGWDARRKLAFWINAYNAFVLRTVIDHYPIRGRSSQYPVGSIRQVPGAFEKNVFRAAGRAVTLDQIEKDIIVPLGDARALLALGRGAVGGARLRSEAYDADRLEEQLATAVRETVDRREIVFVDAASGVLSVSPLFSWREQAFVQAFAGRADGAFASRSPLERAVLRLIAPNLVRSEKAFLEANTFKMAFHEFDWTLNDLTGR
ncbi:MAG TPA: DUF547 domain-containing protein [Vicinamibacterales bacterium]|nr:DUF547 domain-containing protein [Vicinamibacterales bacterium]